VAVFGESRSSRLLSSFAACSAARPVRATSPAAPISGLLSLATSSSSLPSAPPPTHDPSSPSILPSSPPSAPLVGCRRDCVQSAIPFLAGTQLLPIPGPPERLCFVLDMERLQLLVFIRVGSGRSLVHLA
jgi:hypothetical protein